MYVYIYIHIYIYIYIYIYMACMRSYTRFQNTESHLTSWFEKNIRNIGNAYLLGLLTCTRSGYVLCRTLSLDRPTEMNKAFFKSCILLYQTLIGSSCFTLSGSGTSRRLISLVNREIVFLHELSVELCETAEYVT